jgi:hypothetical protein
VVWTGLIWFQDRDQWRALVNMFIILAVRKEKYSLSAE